MSSTDPQACSCGRPHDNWPSSNGTDQLCQECWEAECSASWWEQVQFLALACPDDLTFHQPIQHP